MRTLLFLCVACATASPTPNKPIDFYSENDRAMTKMMDAMMVHPSGNIDADFVAMMSPHHRGAVDMAMLELRYGHNEQLKRLAQEIIVTQEDEIRAMALAVKGGAR